MSDLAVFDSAVRPIAPEDPQDTSLILGPMIRSTKYCKIHPVVASSWQAESAEAHVFQPAGKGQARFLNRSVWPKLRKSRGFKREIKKDDGRVIFIVADDGETSAKKIEAPGLVPEEPDNTEPVTEALLLNNPATSTLPTPHQLPAGISASTVGKSIFLRYLRECHGDEPTPAFQSEGFPSTTEDETTKVDADQSGMLEFIESLNNRRPPVMDENISPQHNSASPAILAGWEEESDTGTRRSKPRQIPQQRCLHFVLSLAADIAEELLDYDADGVCLFGHSFMSKHLYPRQIGMLSSQAFSQHTARQRAWMNHIERTLHHLPGLLKKQEAVSERAWLVSLEELCRIFSDQAASDQLSEEQRRQNVAIMKWIVERSFSGFGPEAIASLAESFTCHTCDGEPATQWMLRIRGNARMRKWAGQELLKAPDAPETANEVLMRLVEAHLAYELILGMKPLLDRMYLVSQEELRDCEWSAAIHSERDKAELERVSNRWEARYSILKTKGIA
jgi:hypothetical protein